MYDRPLMEPESIPTCHIFKLYESDYLTYRNYFVWLSGSDSELNPEEIKLNFIEQVVI